MPVHQSSPIQTSLLLGWEQVADKPHLQIGIYATKQDFSWRAGALYRFEPRDRENSLNVFYQKSLLRTGSEKHRHQVLALGLQAGLYTQNASGYLIHPYLAFSVPENCILNRLQVNMGYCFNDATTTENGKKRNAAHFALWIYL